MANTENLLMKVLVLLFTVSCVYSQKEKAVEFLKNFNKDISEIEYPSAVAEFRKAIDRTDEKTKISENETLKISKIWKEIRQNASKINIDDADADTRRQFHLLLNTMQSKNETVVKQASSVNNIMESIYSTGKVPYKKDIIKSITVKDGTMNLTLNDHLNVIMGKSNDSDELLYVWKAWRDAVGPRIRDKYTEYVRLKNIGAKENGFADAGEYKRKIYEVDDLEKVAEKFWEELKPLYEEVHAYVRHRLSHIYKGIVTEDEPIPAHLLGNMWAQSWDGIYKYMIPFKGGDPLDVTPALKKDYTVEKMFKKAEEFFTSIGWQKLPPSFWEKSLFVRPKDPKRNVTCHASAWDFGVVRNNSEDVRVKMCTLINQEDFVTIHHELGHIYYYLLYWNQSSVYRTGANPGFHEAVGDTLVLSVQTPNHLKRIGLLDKYESTYESEINFLLKTALERIAFLPFGYLMDQWMWSVYSGKIKPENYNKAWWEMRLKYQGIKPPVERTEADFDPGAKYHIPADTPYIRYFFSHILQFTFHRQACHIANQTVLHKCSIYQSKEAGKKLGDMLKLGKQKPWQEALKQYTGSDKLSAEPIKEYFAPLIKWLKKERAEKKYKIGWEGHSTSQSFSLTAQYLMISCLAILSIFTL